MAGFITSREKLIKISQVLEISEYSNSSKIYFIFFYTVSLSLSLSYLL